MAAKVSGGAPSPAAPTLGAYGRLPRGARIREGWEFNRVHQEGVRAPTGSFIVIGRRNDAAHPRFGCAIGKKVGSAVARNRIRRLLKEVFRRLAPSLPPVDLVVVVRPEARALQKLDNVAAELAPAMIKVAERAQKAPLDPSKRARGRRSGRAP